MQRPGHGRAPAARAWLASLVLIVALVGYVAHAMVVLRRGVQRAPTAPAAGVSPAPAGSDGRDK